MPDKWTYTVFYNPDTGRYAILEHRAYLRDYSKTCPAELVKAPYHKARKLQARLNKEKQNE